MDDKQEEAASQGDEVMENIYLVIIRTAKCNKNICILAFGNDSRTFSR